MGALPGTTGRRRLYLMRHGFVDYSSPEVRASRDPSVAYLTDRGKAEAKTAGIALSEVHLDVAFHSGLNRTQETAQIVLAQHELETPELEAESRFQELRSGRYIDFESPQQFAATMTFQIEQAGEPGATFLEDGEKFSDARPDAQPGRDKRPFRPSSTRAMASGLLVAHEFINRMILAWVIGAPLGASAGFEQDTGCINIIDFDLVPDEAGNVRIERAVIKAINLTPANYLKNGMNLRSLEAIFTRPSE